MNWGHVYVALISAITITVLLIGDREARAAIITLFTGSMLTLASVIAWGSYFKGLNPLLLSVDTIVLAIFLGHALISRRYWTLTLPMLQLVNVAIHIASITAPGVLPDVYSIGQGLLAYPQMAIIVGAAIHHRRTRSGKEPINGNS